jgi:hypothetical protein
MKSRRLAGREKSIVRGNGGSVMTLSPWQPEARSGAPMAYVVLRRQTKEAVGIDGRSLGNGTALFRCGASAAARVQRPSIQNIRERYSDHVPPGPNI